MPGCGGPAIQPHLQSVRGHIQTSHPQLLPQRNSHDEVPELANRGWRDYGPGISREDTVLLLMVAEIRGSTHHVEGLVIPFFTRFYRSQVVVWDFFHQQYQEMGCLESTESAEATESKCPSSPDGWKGQGWERILHSKSTMMLHQSSASS